MLFLVSPSGLPGAFSASRGPIPCRHRAPNYRTIQSPRSEAALVVRNSLCPVLHPMWRSWLLSPTVSKGYALYKYLPVCIDCSNLVPLLQTQSQNASALLWVPATFYLQLTKEAMEGIPRWSSGEVRKTRSRVMQHQNKTTTTKSSGDAELKEIK